MHHVILSVYLSEELLLLLVGIHDVVMLVDDIARLFLESAYFLGVDHGNLVFNLGQGRVVELIPLVDLALDLHFVHPVAGDVLFHHIVLVHVSFEATGLGVVTVIDTHVIGEEGAVDLVLVAEVEVCLGESVDATDGVQVVTALLSVVVVLPTGSLVHTGSSRATRHTGPLLAVIGIVVENHLFRDSGVESDHEGPFVESHFLLEGHGEVIDALGDLDLLGVVLVHIVTHAGPREDNPQPPLVVVVAGLSVIVVLHLAQVGQLFEH